MFKQDREAGSQETEAFSGDAGDIMAHQRQHDLKVEGWHHMLTLLAFPSSVCSSMNLCLEPPSPQQEHRVPIPSPRCAEVAA